MSCDTPTTSCSVLIPAGPRRGSRTTHPNDGIGGSQQWEGAGKMTFVWFALETGGAWAALAVALLIYACTLPFALVYGR